MRTTSRPVNQGVLHMNVLAIDIGGTHVKMLATGEASPRRFPSGPTMTVEQMVSGVRKAAAGWNFTAIAIGYPGVVFNGRPASEPHNLAPGWVGFDFQRAFGLPVKLVNDAAMQALGSYQGGKMLFLGLGTGLGSAMVVDGEVEAMELGHLPYRNGTYEKYLGNGGLKRRGKAKWRRSVTDVVTILAAALEPTDVVIGGGNASKLKKLPEGCRLGNNANAFVGGFRLWEPAAQAAAAPLVAGHSAAGEPTLFAGTAESAKPGGLTALPSWAALGRHDKMVRGLHLRTLFEDDTERGPRLATEADGVYPDYSKNRITQETLSLLLRLADESGLQARIDAMFSGEAINVTEHRAVLHIALRAPRGEVVLLDGEDVMPRIHAVLERMANFAQQICSGGRKGATRTSSTLGLAGRASAPAWPSPFSKITATGLAPSSSV